METRDEFIENIISIEKILHVMRAKHEQDKKQRNLIEFDKTKTFKNFVVGPGNQLAYNAAMEITKNIVTSGKYPELYIHGESGLGKTHLINAIANHLHEIHPDLRIKMSTAKTLMEEMISFMKVNRISDFFNKYTEDLDVLIVDDIQDLKNKEGTQEQFLHISKELQRNGKQIVYASDLPPGKLNGITNKVLSQLHKSLVVDIQKPDLETSISILKVISENISFPTSNENILVVAENTEHNPAKLLGALLRIKAASELMNVEICESFIKKELSLI